MESGKRLLYGLVFGIIFGFLLQKGGAAQYDVILGQLLLEDFTVVKIMLSAVVTASVLLYLLHRLGWIVLAPKSGSLGQNVIGGLLFGVGFALLGYCPGTIAAAAGNGYLDAAIPGLIGILLGSRLFAALYPGIKDGVLKWGFYGPMRLPQLLHLPEWAVVFPLAAMLIVLLIWLERVGL